jgi:ribulose-bisphosphate carboxylase large chain
MGGLCPCGERFAATYELTAGGEAAARRIAGDICIEQTVEFPADLITRPDIRGEVFGRIESLEPAARGRWRCRISYAVELAGGELTQLVNVLFGNTSLKSGIRLVDFTITPALGQAFPGPRFGVAGLRALLGVPKRALLCSALKPLGLGAAELAGLAHDMAIGGIDVIKDDHGLADQPFCRFEARVEAVAAAVARAVTNTGKPCLYAPNVTAPIDRLGTRVRFAAQAGAGAVLIAPGLVGLDALRSVASMTDVRVPVLCHPALQGGYAAATDAGMSHRVAYGLLPRLAGADATIFPHVGGRFGYTADECLDLVDGAIGPFGGLKPVVPVPAGGMTVERVAELARFYGGEVMLLIGGDLHRHGPTLAASCRTLVAAAERAADERREPPPGPGL